MIKNQKMVMVGCLVFSLWGIRVRNAQRLFNATPKHWAEQTLKGMSQEQKIGQLFMVRAYPDGPDHKIEKINQLIKKFHLGGAILFQYRPRKRGENKDPKPYDPAALVTQINKWQEQSAQPLLVGIDAEWGVGMRFKDAMKFPKNMTLGALRDEHSIYKAAREIGRQCRAIGAHVNFAPVIDINTNPKNPIIGNRAFSDDKQRVASKGLLYAQGLEDGGVLSCVKHFPGHGDTLRDSHKQLPVIEHDLQRLHQEELFPFKKLFTESVPSVMVGHLEVPAFGSQDGRPSTLSYAVSTGLLKTRMGYKGLVFSDSLKMHAITKHFGTGEAELLALKAGIDVLLMPSDMEKAVQVIKAALAKGDFSEKELDKRVLKILQTKERLGLHNRKILDVPSLSDVHTKDARVLKRRLFRRAITMINNDKEVVPLKPHQKKAHVLVQVGGNKKHQSLFARMAKRYGFGEVLYIPTGSATTEQVEQLQASMAKYETAVICLMLKMSPYGNIKNMCDPIKTFVESLGQQKNKTVVGLFTSPYVFNKMTFKADAVMLAHQKDPDAIKGFLDAVFGKFKPSGRLPIEVKV